MGRSSDPGRERRRSGTGEAAVTVVKSRPGFGGGVFPWKRSRVSSVGAREGGRKYRSGGLPPEALLVEIGGFKVPNLWETQ
jgi:hypothetical protein